MTEKNSLFIKHDLIFIENLLNNIAQGTLRVPLFQRAFVWRPKDMAGLFDSIYKGYPMGTLLFWESAEHFESLDSIGIINIPDQGTADSSYIIDGYQRLATLFGTLHISSDKSSENTQENRQWRIWFDLKNKEFVHVPKGIPKPCLFPVGSLLRTVNFLEQTQRLEHSYKDESSVFINEAEQLAIKIKNYKVPVTCIKGGNIEQAITIFSRLNTHGVPRTPEQMISTAFVNSYLQL